MSTAVKRLGQFFVHREVETWARINIIAAESKLVPFPSHKRICLLWNAPYPDKIALTNGVNKSEFDHFQTLRISLVKFKKKLLNQQDTGKVSKFEQ